MPHDLTSSALLLAPFSRLRRPPLLLPSLATLQPYLDGRSPALRTREALRSPRTRLPQLPPPPSGVAYSLDRFWETSRLPASDWPTLVDGHFETSLRQLVRGRKARRPTPRNIRPRHCDGRLAIGDSKRSIAVLHGCAEQVFRRALGSGPRSAGNVQAGRRAFSRPVPVT
jgi:hypothetical protein